MNCIKKKLEPLNISPANQWVQMADGDFIYRYIHGPELDKEFPTGAIY